MAWEEVASSFHINSDMPSYRIYGVMPEGTTIGIVYVVAQLCCGSSKIHQLYILIQAVSQSFEVLLLLFRRHLVPSLRSFSSFQVVMPARYADKQL